MAGEAKGSVINLPLHHRFNDAQCLGLLNSELITEHGTKADDLPANLVPDLSFISFKAADLKDRRCAGSGQGEHVLDAPEGETSDEQAGQNLNDERLSVASDGGQHGETQFS